jgi:hydrogenase expression/formation protein HypC
MCLAIPSRIERIEGNMAVVEAGDERRTVNLMLLDEEVVVGDYVLVRNGQFAYERVDVLHALKTLALVDQLVRGSDGADVRAW